jgi:hypothetical protein
MGHLVTVTVARLALQRISGAVHHQTWRHSERKTWRVGGSGLFET